MPKVSPNFASFSRGEISSLVSGRVDYEGYFNGATELTNFQVRVQGPITRRSGFEYIASAGVTTEKVRVIPFEFSALQA